MRRLAESSGARSECVARIPSPARRDTPVCATRLDSTFLMPPGSGLTISHLNDVPVAHRLWQGEQAAARLACTLLDADIAAAGDWLAAKKNPFDFLKKSLDDWLSDHRGSKISEQFYLDLTLSTGLDRYFSPNSNPTGDASAVFLTVEPESAGYVILGPTIKILEAAHPRLPATFVHLFLGALNRWVRVYDYRDALGRVERLREWYESDPDPERGEVELPDIERCIPVSLKKQPLGQKSLQRIVPRIENQVARRLMQLAIQLHELSCTDTRPAIREDARELLMDCGEPVPALLAVFERNDAIEGCFDEECQGMLELTPEPNLIVPFNGESKESVLGAFTILATVCNTLSCASELMKIMPGNERVG